MTVAEYHRPKCATVIDAAPKMGRRSRLGGIGKRSKLHKRTQFSPWKQRISVLALRQPTPKNVDLEEASKATEQSHSERRTDGESF
jgi:hypothetical protein